MNLWRLSLSTQLSPTYTLPFPNADKSYDGVSAAVALLTILYVCALAGDVSECDLYVSADS